MLELAATTSPASTGSSAAGRALGPPRFQEAYLVAVASDSCWQFGLARKTSSRDRHAVRLSKLPDVMAVTLESHSSARIVALLARRLTSWRKAERYRCPTITHQHTAAVLGVVLCVEQTAAQLIGGKS